jgi:hypothetical protein
MNTASYDPMTYNNNIQRRTIPMMDTVTKVWNATPDETKRKIADTIINRVSSGKGGDGSGNGKRSRHSSGYSLSKAPNPSAVNLDSGIVPNTYTSDYLDAELDGCSPLHMTGVKLRFPDYSASKLYDYFLQIIAFDLQSKAQANIGFNLNVNTDFTADKILTAMNALLDALQLYFYHMSIVSYHSDPVNKNEGMIYLRAQMNPAMFENLSQLGRRLADTPVPPRLLELVRYMSSTFYSGDNQGSSLIKTYPIVPNATLVDNNALINAITTLALPANNQVYTLLRRSVPNWSPGTLYDVNPNPVFDKNFLSIFANLPFTGPNSTLVVQVPTVTTDTATINYNSFTNELDGVAYALTSVWKTAASEWLPGLIRPTNVVTTGLNVNIHTRKSFYIVAGVKQFVGSDSVPFLVRSRQESYSYKDEQNGYLTAHLFGADKCKGVSYDTIKETSLSAIDYLMSLDTVKSAAKRSGFNDRASNSDKSKSSRRRKS